MNSIPTAYKCQIKTVKLSKRFSRQESSLTIELPCYTLPVAKINREEAIIDTACRLLGAKNRAYGNSQSPIRQVDKSAYAAILDLVGDKTVVQGDDCAVWNAGEFDLLVTTDMLIENTHFLLPSDDRLNSLRKAGFKSVSVNISDIAACGGIPIGFVVSLGIPDIASDEEINSFTNGVGKAARLYGVEIWGGDLVVGREWTICITAIGAVEKGRAVLRKGALPGQYLAVAGAIGLAYAGFFAAFPQTAGQSKKFSPNPGGFQKSLKAFHMPVAQVEIGRYLSTSGLATAMIDTSDSLAKSARLLSEASKCGVILDFSHLKPHPEVTRMVEEIVQSKARNQIGTKSPEDAFEEALIQFLLDSAEDFNLMFAIAEPDCISLDGVTKEILSIIGKFVSKPGVWIMRNGIPEKIAETGFEHFKNKGRTTG